MGILQGLVVEPVFYIKAKLCFFADDTSITWSNDWILQFLKILLLSNLDLVQSSLFKLKKKLF